MAFLVGDQRVEQAAGADIADLLAVSGGGANTTPSPAISLSLAGGLGVQEAVAFGAGLQEVDVAFPRPRSTAPGAGTADWSQFQA